MQVFQTACDLRVLPAHPDPLVLVSFVVNNFHFTFLKLS